jgi:chemotaxis protein CheX
MSLQLLDDDLAGVGCAIWSAIMGADEEPQLLPPTDPFDGPTVTACVHITGGWQGSVAVVLPSALADEVASAMFCLPAAELSRDEVLDAVGELANIAGGNVKGAIEESCALSLPVVAEGSSYTLALPGTRVTRSVALAHHGLPFWVQIHEPTSGPA